MYYNVNVKIWYFRRKCKKTKMSEGKGIEMKRKRVRGVPLVIIVGPHIRRYGQRYT